MKLSVSLPEDDVAFVDKYAATVGASSRSGVIHQAIALLRTASLEEAYAMASDEWFTSGEAGLWAATIADGVADAAR
jgi:Arc/MetJ-type ribon-helix-helix transcriptional regulator